MPDEELIDQVARAMTRSEPSTRLRHAVRARIAQHRSDRVPGREGFAFPRPGAAQQVRRVWIPMAAVAVLVLSVIVARSLSGPGLEPLRSTKIAGVPYVTPPVTPQVAPPVAGVREHETSVRVSGPRRAPGRSIVVDPLVIEPISVPLIAVDSSSGVMPIEIEPLQVEPLQPQ